MKLSTIAVAGLVGAAFMAAPLTASAAPVKQKRTGERTCTYEQKTPARPKTAKRKNEKIDCIVVLGDPSQDGRAALRRALQAANRTDLKRNGIKPSTDHGRKTGKPTS